MTDHDPMCPEAQPDPGDTLRQSGCLCHLIAKVRADEVERRFGWVSQEDARAWFLADLRAKVEALAGVHDVWLYREDVLALLEP